ncbi:hypothetical protein [Pontimicrobium sp. MEBiC06410]
MSIVTIEIDPLQIIIASEDAQYKKNLECYFNNYYPFVDVFLVKTTTEALAYFNDKPPFKFLIRKPEIPLSKADLKNCKATEIRDVNLRLVVFQNQHKKAVKTINKKTIRYLKQEKHLFIGISTFAVLGMLEHKGLKHRFYKFLAHASSVLFLKPN